jgi:putative two-component system response regulator
MKLIPLPNEEQTRHTILIVDDTPENLTILGEPLLHDYNVRIANSGEKALRIAHKSPTPDLILLDVMMPEMDGYEVLTRLRSEEATKEIPVIFVTALDSTDDETKGLQLGAADYITKPIQPAIVLARVRSQIELKQARDKMKDMNAWLEKEIERHIYENQLIQDASLRALACLAETRDDETGNHILRTQGYVEVLCQQLAKTEKYMELMTPKFIATVTKAAPLHDIGKVGIPDNVLHKPGKLSPEEWKIMKTHSELGAKAIKKSIEDQKNQTVFDFLHVAMDIAHYHHEKWDGSGYPEGLAGTAIHLYGRITAIADVFDALGSKRCYKNAWDEDAIFTYMASKRALQFDPDLIDWILAHRQEMSQVRQLYPDPDLE